MLSSWNSFWLKGEGSDGVRMKKISVIVPVYNVEQYIERCLESICAQTWSDMEVLCINDGSTDQSGEICEKYAKRDNRIKVFYRENGGAAAARNVGLQYATGEYIGFVDPDDWIEPDMFEAVIKRMESCDADMGVCGFYKNWDDKEIEMLNQPAVELSPFDREAVFYYAFKRYSYKSFAGYLWNKIFKRKLLTESQNSVCFDEELKVCEDVLFFSMVALRVKRAVYVDSAKYHYYQRDTSLCHAGSLEERAGNLVTYGRLINILNEAGISSDVIQYVKRFYTYHASLLTEKAYYDHDICNMKRMQNEIGKYIADYEATSEEHQEWNIRMRLMMRDAERAIIYSRNLTDRARRQSYAQYLTEPVESKWILYESFFGKGMICGPYAIFKAFMQREDFNQYVHIWSVSVESELVRLQEQFRDMSNVRFVLRRSLEYTEYLAKSKFLINNNTFFYFFIKRKEQIYINTWHGIPMKKLGYDVPDGIIAQHNSFRNFLMTDYLLAWNLHMGQVFMDAYKLGNGYQGKIILEGCPRNDNILNTDAKQVIAKLKTAGVMWDEAKKVVLYAPTFRGANLQEAENDYLKVKKFLAELEQQVTDSGYQILYKPHHLIYDQIRKEGIQDCRVIPSWFDANEIMSVTDILISDYSSIYFDFLITDRPIIFYVPDEAEYKEYRGLYFSTGKLPGAVCKTVGQVAESIDSASDYLSDYGEIHQKFKDWACGHDDGKVSKRILDKVIDGTCDCQILNNTSENTERHSILILCGSLYEEEKFRKLLEIIGEYDLDECEVTVLFDEPKTEKTKKRIMTLDKRIRGLSRVTAMVVSSEEEVLYESYLDGKIEYNSALRKIFEREYKRCVPKLSFQEIRLAGDDLFSKGILLAVQEHD